MHINYTFDVLYNSNTQLLIVEFCSYLMGGIVKDVQYNKVNADKTRIKPSRLKFLN